jgi:hypothetical protein
MMYYRNRSRTYFAMGNLEAARADVLKMQTLTDDPETLAELESALKELDQLVESKTP